MRQLVWALAVAGAVVACDAVASLPLARPIDHLDPGATPPPGDRTRIERATLVDGGSTLVLEFTGGPDFDPDEVCSIAYVGWAAPDDTIADALRATVVDVTPSRVVPDGIGCDAVGHPRFVRVPLERPFEGSRVIDDTEGGGVLLVRAPDGLATLPAVPDGWTLGHAEGSLESPGGGWSRTYVGPGVHPETLTGPGTLRVVQSFGDSMAWAGGTDDRDVTVNGAQGMVSHDDVTGELVLVWRLGPDGMALVASEADFTAAELLRFAEGVRTP